MENMNIKIILLFLTFILSSCDKKEILGFFTSYVNVNDRFEQSIEWNNQNAPFVINIPNTTYTIYAMGDSHVGGIDNLDIFFKNAQKEDATAVVMVGDLTKGHVEDYDLISKHIPLKDSLISFSVAGNHDLYFDGWKNYYPLLGSSTYFFIVNTPNESDLFICLDSGGGTLGNKQLDWFKTLLETKRHSFRYCTVFTHNNIFRLRSTKSTNPFVEEIYVLLDLFVRHNINMVVTGHDHKRNTTILGKTTHIIMDSLQDENDNASFLKIFINKENIDYSFSEI